MDTSYTVEANALLYNSSQAGENICLSTGDPPFPSAIENTVCGPQVPGTTPNGTEYGFWGELNPCPLNACRDVWGECGITPEFCTQTESTTGNPGTAASGTNGCISNCGTAITRDPDGPDDFLALGYVEAFNKDRSRLTMDVYSIDTSKYTHVVYAFGLIGSGYSISINDSQSDMFDDFLALDDVKRIVSFGGWDFSTSTETYMIFREEVTSANRDTLAQNVADFISTNGIDGVDFGCDDDGPNYVAFLKALRSLVGDDITISIAMPASVWYLQAFPVSDLNDVVDFFIYMTYDLHGQWDYGNDSSDDDCVDGNCLRSHVNLTETNYALSMVTNGGAQSNKLMVDVMSYDSGATPGRCTQTTGYIPNVEIYEIISTNPNVQVLFDDDSDSHIIVYNDTQWVEYMTNTTKSTRTTYYKGLNMGGITEWAIDLEQFTDDPDDLVIVNLSADLTDAEQCDFPDQSEETSEEASLERNVAAYIDSLLTSVIKEYGSTASIWDRKLFGDESTEVSSLNEDVHCDIPSSDECPTLNKPSHYWARFVVANFRLYMSEYYDLFQVVALNATNKVDQLVADFPTKTPDVVDLASLLTNFIGALGLVSGFTGDGLATTLTAAAGGLFSEAGSNVSSDDDDDSTTELSLYNKISDLYTAFYEGAANSLIDIFDNADISNWPSSLISGTYTHDIAHFFDGPFMYELSGLDQSKMETYLNRNLFATFAGTALASANYYILKGAHTVTDCPDITSGTIIHGYCYTLEYLGAGWSLVDENDFSDPIDSDDLTKFTDTYYVNLKELYANSYKCQNSTGNYEGLMDSDLPLTATTTLLSCLYNLPVFTVDSDGGVTSSPCLVLSSNETDSTTMLGVSYMPLNPVDIFDDDFCFCNGGNRECSD
ncbi:uncharacterized protein N7458_000028 [Penicillium daleae]|uniref:chitinase n=1 Tax=Penicillium daleae TaxID=63821 RepID=A0AAD6CFJ2_9EURO|nr:uncharacterized protein N7458_000028 [Penicillium daleae]KAJ5464342.1 hypothetical protein N7458_000028 [Penicillium daleae]